MIVDANEEEITRAAEAIRAGELVAFPTETVYGLGADATNGVAVARIFEAKGRPRFNPLIAHVLDIEAAADLAQMPEPALRIAHAFWPGPLTLVLPLRGANARLSPPVTAGLDTVAIRIPSHPVARRLLAEAAVPIAAPSANPSGRVSPTLAAHVAEDLAPHIAVILDGGPAMAGLESTIVDMTGEAVLLRAGAITRAEIEATLGARLGHSVAQGIKAPGQLESHYAPRAQLRMNIQTAQPGEALLGFGPDPGAVLNLSPAGDLREAAANLFAMLRALDAVGYARIAVMPIPEIGLGEAINDRLRRASAPR